MKNTSSNVLREALHSARYIFVAVAFFSFFLNLLMLVAPLYMMQIYDRVLTSSSKDTLYTITILAVGLLAISATLELVRARILIRLGAHLGGHLARDLFAVILRDKVMTKQSGSTQPLRDLETLRSFLTGPGLIALFDAPWMPIFLVFVFLVHPWLGIVAASGAATLSILAVLSELTTRKAMRRASTQSLEAHRLAEDALRNADAIWAMGMLGDLRRRWQAKHLSALQNSGNAQDHLSAYSATAKFIRPLLQIGILGTGAYLVIEEQISAGVMIAASILMGRALAPVEVAIGQWKSLASAREAYWRLSKLLEGYEPEGRKMPLPAAKGAVSVEGATLIPPGAATPALVGIDFRLEPGDLLGVIGPSAAGKSCLVQMLVGIWPPKIGHVRLDGADIAGRDRSDVGRHIGYLPQNVELFDGSVAENIARFQEIFPGEVTSAGQLANAHEMILRLPDGYETQIGEGGCVLSGGQRQRLGLARALYRLPKLVVLDEPNAHLDEEGEQALRLTLRRLKELKCTVIIVSHKRSTLADVDKLLVLKAGKQTRFGPRTDVMEQLWTPKVVDGASQTRARIPAKQVASKHQVAE